MFGIFLGLVAAIVGIAMSTTVPSGSSGSVGNAVGNALGLDSDTGDAVWKTQMQNNNIQSQVQRDWQEKMYFIDREYQSPANQMRLYREAGLNPSLMYGQPIQTGQLGSGAEGSYSGSPVSQLGSLLGLGSDLAMLAPQMELTKAQAKEIESRIPVNQQRVLTLEKAAEQLSASAKNLIKNLETQDSQIRLNEILGEKAGAETHKIFTETSQMMERFPLEMQSLTEEIALRKSQSVKNDAETEYILEQTKHYYDNMLVQWKETYSRIKFMKQQGVQVCTDAMLNLSQKKIADAEAEYKRVLTGIKSDVGKAEAIVGMISNGLSAAGGLVQVGINARNSFKNKSNISTSTNSWEHDTPNYGF